MGDQSLNFNFAHSLFENLQVDDFRFFQVLPEAPWIYLRSPCLPIPWLQDSLLHKSQGLSEKPY